MKKIKISKRRLYEADAVDNEQQQNQSDNANNEQQSNTDNDVITYIGTGNPEIDKSILNSISMSNASQIAQACALFKVNLSHSFQKDIRMPKAATRLQALLCATSMPDKFKNVYDSYDNNPLITISNAEDLAEVYFSPMDTNSAAISEPDDVEESLVYFAERALLEDNGIVTAATAGFKAGAAVTGVAAQGAAAVAGFGVFPYAIGAFVGSNAFGTGMTNDSKLRKKYNAKITASDSEQNIVPAAIDNYVNNFIIILEQSLNQLSGHKNANDVTKLTEMVTSALNTRSVAVANDFIEKNNELLKSHKQLKLLKELSKWKAKNDMHLALGKLACNPRYMQKLGITARDLSNWFGNRKELIDPGAKASLASYIKTSSRSNTYGYDDDPFELSDSILMPYDVDTVLNESEAADDKLPTFDADAIYEEMRTLFRQQMNKILTSNPSEWPMVQTAKKQMEALIESADKQITDSIQQVCRMANSDQMGMGSKLMSFVSKHPIRATKLTALWNRHKQDLNVRMEQRLKQISELDGKGPLKMAYEFYKNVIPNLLAMMITYKLLYKLFSNEALWNKDLAMAAMGDQRSQLEVIDALRNAYPGLLAAVFREEGKKINKDNKDIFNGSSFTGEELSYLIPLLQLMLPNDNVNPLTLKDTLMKLDKQLQELASANKVSEFFSRLTDFLIINCNCGASDAGVNLVKEVFSKFDAEKFKKIEQSFIELATNKVFESFSSNKIAPVILGYAFNTNGEILKLYDSNISVIEKCNVNDPESIKNLKVALRITNKLSEDDDNHAGTYIKQALAAILNSATTQSMNINEVIRSYYELHMHEIKGTDLSLYDMLIIFYKMSSNPVLQEVFKSDSNLQSYTELQDLWNNKDTNQSAHDAYIQTISSSADEAKQYTAKALNLIDDLSFNGFYNFISGSKAVKNGEDSNQVMESMDGGAFNDWYLQNKDFASIPGPNGLNDWDAIIKSIFSVKDSTSFKSINAIMSLLGESLERIEFAENGLNTLQSLLMYIIKCRALSYKDKRNDEYVIETLWKKGNIDVGHLTKNLYEIIVCLCSVYNGFDSKRLLDKIISNADTELLTLIQDKDLTGLKGNLWTGLIKEQKGTNLKSVEDFFNYLKDTFSINDLKISDPKSDKAWNNLLIYLNTYILSAKDYKGLASLFKLIDKVPSTVLSNNSNSETNTEQTNKPNDSNK